MEATESLRNVGKLQSLESNLTYLIPWSWVIPEKLPVAQLIKNFTFSGTRSFITVFRRAHHWSLSSSNWIQSIKPEPISLYPFQYYVKYYIPTLIRGARDSVVGWSTMLEAGRSRVRLPMMSLDFSIDLLLPAALWPFYRLKLLTEMCTRNLPGGKRRSAGA
jgi:hypothetical protein